MQSSDPRAADVYQTVGAFLGYAIAHLASVYAFDHVLVLGRVTSGFGGLIILDAAMQALRADFRISPASIFGMPDEQEKRHGQAIAAASLPVRDSQTRP